MDPLSSKRRKTCSAHEMMCPRELALFDADLLASVAPYLDAGDLTNLASTCRHFGAATRGEDGDAGASSLSLVQEAARRAILNEQTKAEKAALVRSPGESSIALYHQLLMLRAPLNFDVLVGKNLEYDDGDKSRAIVSRQHAMNAPFRTRSAISKHIMRGGKHYAEFSEARDCGAVLAGIMRPIPSGCWGEWGELDYFHPASPPEEFKLKILEGRSERWGGSNIDCCMFRFKTGLCTINNQLNHNEWEGQERFECQNGGYVGVLGLLLDLDAGTLTAYKDGRRLGVMCDGLAGEYCWVASISGTGTISIKRGAIPDDA